MYTNHQASQVFVLCVYVCALCTRVFVCGCVLWKIFCTQIHRGLSGWLTRWLAGCITTNYICMSKIFWRMGRCCPCLVGVRLLPCLLAYTYVYIFPKFILYVEYLRFYALGGYNLTFRYRQVNNNFCWSCFIQSGFC